MRKLTAVAASAAINLAALGTITACNNANASDSSQPAAATVRLVRCITGYGLLTAQIRVSNTTGYQQYAQAAVRFSDPITHRPVGSGSADVTLAPLATVDAQVQSQIRGDLPLGHQAECAVDITPNLSLN